MHYTGEVVTTSPASGVRSFGVLRLGVALALGIAMARPTPFARAQSVPQLLPVQVVNALVQGLVARSEPVRRAWYLHTRDLVNPKR
jgi:hypothetical protein